jgi:hypothetical protein
MSLSTDRGVARATLLEEKLSAQHQALRHHPRPVARRRQDLRLLQDEEGELRGFWFVSPPVEETRVDFKKRIRTYVSSAAPFIGSIRYGAGRPANFGLERSISISMKPIACQSLAYIKTL